MRTRLALFLRDRRAATSIEYAIIATGIATAIIATVGLLGDKVLALFVTVNTALN